jgi:redox-sensitive bicupin YhaK (pirin superfamily)
LKVLDRKDFIRKGLLGTSLFVSSSSKSDLFSNNIDELKPLDIVGFNHLPNTKSNIMENSVFHPADSRGDANHGWLQSKHTFSFANYYNPDRMHFGVLRVLNDDTVASGMGFGTHPHDNMEIISIPLEGDLEHKDSMGNTQVIKHGDIQVMSAGTGIYHSEYNRNKNNLVKFLQIWVFPNKRDVTPRYDQITLNQEDRQNRFQQILSPSADDEGVWIQQDAWFHLGKFEKNKTTNYTFKKESNGVYVFVLSGKLEVNGQLLNNRDGFGIWNSKSIEFKFNEDSEVLLIEVPMNV